LAVFHLDSTGRYVRCRATCVLSGFPIAAAAELVRRRGLQDETQLLRGFREYIRSLG
jgi:hypothetical protein